MPNIIPNKDRMKMPRQHMPERDPHVRAHNFEEVNLGFDLREMLIALRRGVYRAATKCLSRCARC